jgi:hypothetical protein
MKKSILILLAGLTACDVSGTAPRVDPDAPTNLTFQLTPSGDPNVPDGILLRWDPPSNGQALSFDIYGRSNSTGWIRRATTTSNTFHDAGVPQSQYRVTAIDEAGNEMGESEIVTVDLTDRLPAPQALTSITLNQAVHLTWTDNVVQGFSERFDYYRVYSSAYSSAKSTCEADWYFEGSTVSDAFLVGNLTNGVTRCYAVSAISLDGHESTWSNARLDTPRPDARSVIVYAAEAKTDSAAFVFNDEVAKIFGVTGAASRFDADFTISKHPDGTFWLTPARVGATARAYQTAPIAELGIIDKAPLTGYATSAIMVTPGMGIVFRLDEADGTHYGAMRVQFVSTNFIVFDWAYQNGIGNIELSAGRPGGGM